MNLFSETAGHGPDLVLLHGWGLHSGVWDETAAALAENFRVTWIDLPGHGRSPWLSGHSSLTTLTQQLLDSAPPHAIWLGWSLGGIIALQLAAQHPERVNKLVLVASTPKFVNAPDWEHGVAADTLDEFVRALASDYRSCIKRFLALQLRGSAHAAQTLRRLDAIAFRYGEPDRRALSAGLELLRDSDLRSELGGITCPSLVIAGERDTLTPPDAQRYLAAHLPQAHLSVIPRAGHAPFLSHAPEFLRALNESMQQ
ncbi:MAG: pimeloyl-ACP methyl ester esterase BioH [Proteobacteria bacterium]|nr:pimeloyl-ACP methyl ester esterase BioH [Pseudomonadota bacterium]